MAINITPSLGANIAASNVYALTDTLPVKLGTVVRGDDAHLYVLAQASAPVTTAGTDVILTEPAMTFATGAGAWEITQASVATGERVWLRSTLPSAVS